ncbi:hypothetical protein WJX72_006771 [[Myrmecia] bisecta]|uniref:DUF1499 domain-containing protein n=1 Tax=[Myrmecia] bisecta TaxID=41462 RepID=A0AAW1PXH3_9CHLO
MKTMRVVLGWLLGGLLFAALGTTQAVLAARWNNGFGIAVGIVAALVGSMLLLLGVSVMHGTHDTSMAYARVEPDEGQKCRARYHRAVQWLGHEATTAAAQAWRWPLAVFAAYVALLIAVHCASPDVLLGAFPPACGDGQSEHCSRVADSHPHRNRDLSPLTIATPQSVAILAARFWIATTSRSQVLEVTNDFIHARVVSLLWGFADDFFVHVTCGGSRQEATIEVQSSSRLGVSDFGVNGARNEAFLLTLRGKQQKGAFPEGPCQT